MNIQKKSEQKLCLNFSFDSECEHCPECCQKMVKIDCDTKKTCKRDNDRQKKGKKFIKIVIKMNMHVLNNFHKSFV